MLNTVAMRPIEFIVEFCDPAGWQCLLADRIQADGRGNLILYRDRKQFRSLALAHLQTFHIWPTDAGMPAVTVQ